MQPRKISGARYHHVTTYVESRKRGNVAGVVAEGEGEGAGEAGIRDFDVPRGTDQNVLRLDVAVDDAVEMQVAEAEEDLKDDGFDGLHGDAAAELVGIGLEVVIEILEVEFDFRGAHYNAAQSRNREGKRGTHFTMLGCCNSRKIEISRINTGEMPSSSFDMGITLSANVSFVWRSRTLYLSHQLRTVVQIHFPIRSGTYGRYLGSKFHKQRVQFHNVPLLKKKKKMMMMTDGQKERGP